MAETIYLSADGVSKGKLNSALDNIQSAVSKLQSAYSGMGKSYVVPSGEAWLVFGSGLRSQLGTQETQLENLEVKLTACITTLAKVQDEIREVDENYRDKLSNSWWDHVSNRFRDMWMLIFEGGGSKCTTEVPQSESSMPTVEDYFPLNDTILHDDGVYGGNQKEPMTVTGEEKDELYEIVRRYYPNYSDKQISRFLKKLNYEGCGYVALANTIFAEYIGRETEFEKTFGFSMRNESGKLNYNKLIVDFYAATDNHIPDSQGNDSVNHYEDVDKCWEKILPYNADNDKNGSGTYNSTQKYRLELYMESRGVNVNVTPAESLTSDMIQKALNGEGYIIINYHNGPLLNASGEKVGQIDGGHAMTVTGLTEDGKLIVSSWGDKYYIDPTIIEHQESGLTFDGFVKYEVKEYITSMSFQFIQY